MSLSKRAKTDDLVKVMVDPVKKFAPIALLPEEMWMMIYEYLERDKDPQTRINFINCHPFFQWLFSKKLPSLLLPSVLITVQECQSKLNSNCYFTTTDVRNYRFVGRSWKCAVDQYLAKVPLTLECRFPLQFRDEYDARFFGYYQYMAPSLPVLINVTSKLDCIKSKEIITAFDEANGNCCFPGGGHLVVKFLPFRLQSYFRMQTLEINSADEFGNLIEDRKKWWGWESGDDSDSDWGELGGAEDNDEEDDDEDEDVDDADDLMREEEEDSDGLGEDIEDEGDIQRDDGEEPEDQYIGHHAGRTDQQVDEKAKKFDHRIPELLTKMGSTIYHFAVESKGQRFQTTVGLLEWYKSTVECLKLLPNLKSLYIRMPYFSVDQVDIAQFEREIAEIEIPKFPHLQVLQCDGLSLSVVDAIVIGNPQIEKLAVNGFGDGYPKVTFDDVFFVNRPKCLKVCLFGY